MEQPPGPERSLVPWPCSAGTAGAPMTTSAGTGGGELSKGKGAEKQQQEELGSSSARSSSSTVISPSLASPIMEAEQPRGELRKGKGAEKQEDEELWSSTDRSGRSTMTALSFASPMEEEQQPRDLGLSPSPVLSPCSVGTAGESTTTTMIGWQGTSTGKGKQAKLEEVRSASMDRSRNSTMISLSPASPMEEEELHSPGLSPVPRPCSAEETGSMMMTTPREATSASGRCVVRKVMGNQAEEEELWRSTSKDESSLKMVPQQSPTLPMDLVFDVIEQSNDVRTVVRCALGSKTMLRDIMSFLEKRAKANGGFNPSFLIAVSYRVTTCNIDNEDGVVTRTHSVVFLPPAAGRLGLDTDLLCGSSEPASSRDGLLVLFQHKRIAPCRVVRHGILVVNTITGHVMTLPSMGHQRGTSTEGMFKPALLSVNGGAGRSFELLVINVMYNRDDDHRQSLVTQIFSSQENEWGAARRVHIHNLPPIVKRLKEAASTAPAMVGRRVHWLCYTQQYDTRRSSYIDRDLIILALDSELAHATVIEVPEELQKGIRHFLNPAWSLILATTTATAQGEERQLSIVAAEALVISMWTLVSTDGVHSWCRQVVIRRREVGRPHASVLDAYQQIRFSVFGERSGTVLFWMHGTGLVQLNLGTKKSVVLKRIGAHNKDTSEALLYEINLMSVLRGMESS